MSHAVDTAKIPDLTTAAALRKVRKPLIERKRRERINTSMDELKSLVLTAMHKDEEEFNKMEKADILEMTVQYIRTLRKSGHSAQVVQRRVQPPSASPPAVCPSQRPATLARPIAQPAARQSGILTCAQETRSYLAQMRPELAERAYARLTQLATPAGSPPAAHQPTTPRVHPRPEDLPVPRRYLRVDPSLTRPLSVVVPSERTSKNIWRPF